MVQFDEHDVEDLKSFVFMASYVSTSGGNEEDIRARMGKVLVANKKLGRILKDYQSHRETRSTVFSLIHSPCCCIDEKRGG